MIIILVFVPLFALSGIEGRLFAPLGIAYIVSILASLIISITRDTGARLLLPGGIEGARTSGDSFAGSPSQGRQPRVPALGLPATAPFCWPSRSACWRPRLGAYRLPRAFLPPFNEGTMLVNLQYNPGISLAESNRLGRDRRATDHAIPEVKSLGPPHRARRTG